MLEERLNAQDCGQPLALYPGLLGLLFLLLNAY